MLDLVAIDDGSQMVNEDVYERLKNRQTRLDAQTCVDLPASSPTEGCKFWRFSLQDPKCDCSPDLLHRGIVRCHPIDLPAIDLAAVQEFYELGRNIVESLVAKNARLLAKSLQSAALASPQCLDDHRKNEQTLMPNVLEYLAGCAFAQSAVAHFFFRVHLKTDRNVKQSAFLPAIL